MPPGVVTLSSIRTAAQQRADQVNSSFVSNAEWLNYINGSWYELYDLILQKYGDDYFASTVSPNITTDGTNDKYALATDFYKLLGVDIQLAGTPNSWVTVPRFTFAERNRYSIPNFQTYWGVTNLRYRLFGNNLWFIPLPAASQTIRYFYAPRLTALVNDSDTVDGVSGWEEYIIVDAAIKALVKEESDVSVLMAQKAELKQRIESAAANRDAGSPATVADTQWRNDSYPGGTGGMGGGGY